MTDTRQKATESQTTAHQPRLRLASPISKYTRISKQSTHLAAVAALGHCAQLDEAVIRAHQQPLPILAEAAAVHGQLEASYLLGLVWVDKVACEVHQLQQTAT
jgi:hypothetical protein